MFKAMQSKIFSKYLAQVLNLQPVVGRVLVLILAAVASLGLLISLSASVNTLEERLGALGWTLAADPTLEQRIVLVSIDEKSLAEVGPWPWSRETMATLVDALNKAGVQQQLHDIVYSEPKVGDDALISALQASPGVVLAQAPAFQSDQTMQTGTLTHALSSISCDAAQSSTQGYVAAHAGFAGFPKGHIAPVVDSDGSIRKIPLTLCVDGKAYPALALTALLQAVRNPVASATIITGNSLLAAAQQLQLDAYPGLQLPLDNEGNLRISYKKRPESFLAISAVDVINGSADADLLLNSWVLVGVTAFGVGDIWPTPYSGTSPGIEIQARILSSMLDDAIPYTPRTANWLLVIVSLASALGLLAMANNRGRFAAYGLPVAAVTLPLAALALHILLLGSLNVWLGWVAPALYGVLAASFLLLLEQSRVRIERTRIFNNLNSYLPSDIARDIAYSLPSSSIDARRSDVTLLSADLRNFSAFSESRSPEESAAVLHFFFIRAAEIVERNGGRIQEFKGDSLLAVWDGQGKSSAEQAFVSAQAMLQVVNNGLLADHSPPGLEPLMLGIGIEQGPALIGSIGPSHRRSHTLLGDTVTVALRIQEMTADLAQPLLIGECAARQLGDFKLESQGSYLLAGLKIPHTLFAPPFIDSISKGTPTRGRHLKVVSGGRA